jgi:hypothetical protein
VALRVNQGGLVFTSVDLVRQVSSQRVSFLDLDQDGDPDFVDLDLVNDELHLREQLPGGVFAPRVVLDVPAADGVVGLIDVDGDGRDDLITGRELTQFQTRLLTAWIRADGVSYSERREWVVQAAPVGFGDFDNDGDVDVDLLGTYSLENLSRDHRHSGRALQYSFDAASSGSGGFHPVLGARGPFEYRGGSALALCRARGGANAWLLIGTGRTHETVLGLDLVVSDSRLFAALPLGGPSGVPGVGSGRLALRVPLDLVGRTATFQAIVSDPGAVGGLCASNGVEIRFGVLDVR